MLKPILQPLDQTSEFAHVKNTVCDAQITIGLAAGPTTLLGPTRVSALDLSWTQVANARFGDLGDSDHKLWQGDFSGSNTTEILFYNRGDNHWWLGTVAGSVLTWTLVDNSVGFGDLLDGNHAIWIGDFRGAGRDQVLFYNSGDGHWWLGDIMGGQLLHWQLVSSSAGFGNLLDGSHRIWIENFGAGHDQVMFYDAGDGHWWLGTVTGSQLDWKVLRQNANFGNLLQNHAIWTGYDFTGVGHSQVMFYDAGDGHWWLGDVLAGELHWRLVSRSAGFGNLLDSSHRLWFQNFTGFGRAQVLFYNAGDGHWWLGAMTADELQWTLVSQSAGFGNLLDGKHAFWIGDFAGSGHSQVMFYDSGDGHWWLGAITSGQLQWTLVSKSAGFGNLLDGGHAIWQGEYCGYERSALLFYDAGDSNWWLGRVDNTVLNWWIAGNTRGYGNLLDGHHRIWSGRYSGSPKHEVLFHSIDDGNFFLGQFDGARFRLPRALDPGEVLVASQAIGTMVPVKSDPVLVSHNFATQHYDRQRTGWNFRETALTRAKVPGLRKLATLQTDDQIYAQPLYVQNVQVRGQPHNVLYVATESDTVYAFDADSGEELARKRLLRPGEQPVPSRDIYDDKHRNISPVIGITGTPVIDRATNSLFVVSKCKDDDDNYHQRLYSLDLETLGVRPCVADIEAKDTGLPIPATFDPLASNQRPALLLSGGLVYVGFGSHGDQHSSSYHGWLLAFDARTLNLQAVFNAAPLASGEAGIWQSGHGPAADEQGNIYVTTGNGLYSPEFRNFSNCVLKLSAELALLSYFAPAEQAYLNEQDMDLGSGGVILLPDQQGAPNRLLLTGGKRGYIYLLNRDRLGGEEERGDVWQKQELYPGHLSHEAGNPAGSDASQVGMFGGAAYLRNTEGQFIFLCGAGGDGCGQLVRYEISASRLDTDKRRQSVRRFPGGGTPAVTSSGPDPSSAVVWMLDRTYPQLKLVAFNSDDLTNVLTEIEAGPWENSGGIPFLLPTVINGKIYVPSSTGVTVFGP